ncbi:MAG: stage II sporulation protein D, partial [Bacillus sp. (in: firmicutes)]
DNYVTGVVASEMPATFELEALKAQALTARTYIVRQMISSEKLEVPDGALVTDTVQHQVFKNEEELRKIWGKDYSWKIEKIRKAVQETSGQILTYEGSPIDATFFSTSNGYTENAESVWQGALPYLKSVESPWDLNSKEFNGQKVVSVSDFERLLGVKVGSGDTIGKVVERTSSNRVSRVDFNGTVLTGQDIRTKLELKSTDFTWERKGNQIVINTKGYGHGVGMSQYGANGMAQEGKNYVDIAKYYYQGVEVVSSNDLLTKITAQK